MDINKLITEFVSKENGEYNLLVPSGKVVTIPAIDFYFDNILIEEDGILQISEASENWMKLECGNNFTLNGSIVYRKFLADNIERSIVVENILYKHRFKNDNKGGNGGDSGEIVGTIPVSKGVLGTTLFGGGGAAGGYQTSRGNVWPGAVGTEEVGGATPNCKGGDGQRRKKYINGGMLFLDIGNDFIIGPKNKIDLRGEDGGDNGNNGSDGYLRSGRVMGSGGGGGAPGGEGGVLYHKVKNSYSGSLLNILVNGGVGGTGGLGGESPSPEVVKGNNGENGENGRIGFVKIIR
jgi:hypothetical protein